jgi:hypothetical protein
MVPLLGACKQWYCILVVCADVLQAAGWLDTSVHFCHTCLEGLKFDVVVNCQVV